MRLYKGFINYLNCVGNNINVSSSRVTKLTYCRVLKNGEQIFGLRPLSSKREEINEKFAGIYVLSADVLDKKTTNKVLSMKKQNKTKQLKRNV